MKKRLAAWGRRTAVAAVLVAALVAALYVAGFRVVLLRWVVNSGTGYVAVSSDARAECSKISCSVTTVLVVLPNHDWYGVQAWGPGLGLSHFQGVSTRAP